MKNNLRKKNNFNGLTIKIIFHIRLGELQENILREPLTFPYNIYCKRRVDQASTLDLIIVLRLWVMINSTGFFILFYYFYCYLIDYYRNKMIK
jgi:hypothetical protein